MIPLFNFTGTPGCVRVQLMWYFRVGAGECVELLRGPTCLRRVVILACEGALAHVPPRVLRAPIRLQPSAFLIVWSPLCHPSRVRLMSSFAHFHGHDRHLIRSMDATIAPIRSAFNHGQTATNSQIYCQSVGARPGDRRMLGPTATITFGKPARYRRSSGWGRGRYGVLPRLSGACPNLRRSPSWPGFRNGYGPREWRSDRSGRGRSDRTRRGNAAALRQRLGRLRPVLRRVPAKPPCRRPRSWSPAFLTAPGPGKAPPRRFERQ